MGRGLALIIVATVLTAGLVWIILEPKRPLRTAGTFLEAFEFAPIVEGAMPAGVAPGERLVEGGRSETRYWRREYKEASFVLTAKLGAGQVVPFARAVRDSIDDRLERVNATVRGVRVSNWPDDSLGAPRLDRPMTLTIPYATRRRVGWVAVRALQAGDSALTMWVSLFEGPKPSD